MDIARLFPIMARRDAIAAAVAAALLPLLLLSVGCASAPRASGPDPLLVRRLAQEAADQVRRCYRKPKVSSEATQIVTRLRVRYTVDGQLAQLPQIVWQRSVTPATQPFASRMAEAASLAVIRCAPVRLPAAAYAGGWEELEFTFSPQRLG
jgi:hypothetical protein